MVKYTLLNSLIIANDDQAARVKKVKGELVKALGRSPAAVETLIEQEPLGIGDAIAGPEGAQRAEQLAQRMLETDIRVVVEAPHAARIARSAKARRPRNSK